VILHEGHFSGRKALVGPERLAAASTGEGVAFTVRPGEEQQRHLLVMDLHDAVSPRFLVVANASHELRTPLAVTRSQLDVSLLADERRWCGSRRGSRRRSA
jgi:signal transduction histidine kinase